MPTIISGNKYCFDDITDEFGWHDQRVTGSMLGVWMTFMCDDLPIQNEIGLYYSSKHYWEQ